MDLKCAAEIQKVSISVKEKDGLILRMCKVVLAREFDDLIAAAIGTDAKRTRASLTTGGLESAVMPIGALMVSGDFVADGERVTIGRMMGTKATGKFGAETGPTVLLEFEFAYSDEVWIFLGRNVGGVAEVAFTRRQLELAGEGEAA